MKIKYDQILINKLIKKISPPKTVTAGQPATEIDRFSINFDNY